MDENLVEEIRKLLEEMVIAELRAIALKLDAIHEQMVLSEKRMNARTEAIWAEVAKLKDNQPESQAEEPVIQ